MVSKMTRGKDDPKKDKDNPDADKLNPKIHYVVDEKAKTATITDAATIAGKEAVANKIIGAEK